MLKRKVIRPLAFFLLILGTAWLIASCASTPKPTTPPPTPDTVKPEPQPEPEPAKASPVTEEEFQTAEKAIAEARAAEAETYSPGPLNQATKALSEARGKGDSDPAAARILLKTSVDKAHEARDQAWTVQLTRLDEAAQAAIAEATAAGAEKYAPDLLAEAKKALADARPMRTTDPAGAKALYLTSIEKAHAARDASAAQKAKADLTQLDQEAQAAIVQAEAVDADQYAPNPLNRARQALNQARTQTSDPAAAAGSYRLSIDQAHAARDAALVARTQSLVDKLNTALDRWKALQPDRWEPESTQVTSQGEVAKAAVQKDYTTGLPLAKEALQALDEATAKLSARLVTVQDLRVQAQTALDAAEAADAFIWVPDLIQTANDSFFQGTGAWKKFRLDAAEEAWSAALFQAKSAAGKAQTEQERKRTEQLMLETMKKLQDASGKTIVDPQDRIVPPQAWDGQKELDKLQKKPVSMLIPADGSVAVMGDVQRVTYLDEAKDQWAQGVKALDAGDLELANQDFLQAQKLIDTYLAMAVDKVYTVRLIPERRDSLWRISEYSDIYATPWDWPKIWKRNQKLIQNPDLIYPGWQLIIPPQ